MKKLKIVNSLACEYVARGSYGKHTLVNAYAGDIRVRSFPATFPVAFYAEVIPPKSIRQDIKFTVFQGRKKRAEAMASFEFEEGKVAVLSLPPFKFTFAESSKIRVIASGEHFAQTVLLEKMVQAGEFPET
ncbi:hypothetical protein [Sphingosinicella xenopeptidilytica]|uniref:Uncharacterized protein n=1 Tax=Sphingosinicella xenopeptidilytica TaxID=364098 RepID=A0ABW3C7I1_SPHXN